MYDEYSAHWASWMFEVDASGYDPKKQSIIWARGGFQGARGHKTGQEFYIENVMEELVELICVDL